VKDENFKTMQLVGAIAARKGLPCVISETEVKEEKSRQKNLQIFSSTAKHLLRASEVSEGIKIA